MKSILFIFCFALVLSIQPLSYSAIINLPDDYRSLQEAVDEAQSGDVININGKVAYLKDIPLIEGNEINGIRILNKDLSIIGTLPNYGSWITGELVILRFFDSETENCEIKSKSSKNLIVIENSNVLFKNLKLSNQFLHYEFVDKITSAPIQVLSGKLRFENIKFTGLIKSFGELEIIDSSIRGHSNYIEPYYKSSISTNYPIPAIHIRDQKDARVLIHNSALECDNYNSARPIVIENVFDSNINISNTNIIAGRHDNRVPFNTNCDSYWNYSDFKKGLAGIFIVNSKNLSIDFENSKSVGGRGGTSEGLSNTVSPSGPGFEVIDSENIKINGGQFLGNRGGNGVFLERADGNIVVHSGDGGDALYVINSSVILNSVILIPGIGGEGAIDYGLMSGEDGTPIFKDENSTVTFVTTVENWELH